MTRGVTLNPAPLALPLPCCSESEAMAALIDKQRRHFPSLHTSIDEEDLPMPESLGN